MEKMSTLSPVERAKKSPTFCILPFMGLYNQVNGSFLFCCKSQKTLGNVSRTSMEKVWNNNKAKKIRHQLLNGKKPSSCYNCWKAEEDGVMSHRLKSYSSESKNFSKYSHVLNNLTEDCELPFEIPRLDVEFSNLCNLRCRMCNIHNSTKWIQDHEAVKHINPDLYYLYWKSLKNISTKEQSKSLKNKKKHKSHPNYYMSYWGNSRSYNEDLLKLGPHLRHIDFAGGEPLIEPYHYEFLKRLSKNGKQIMLSYSTNLHKSLKDKNIFNLWKKFKKVIVTVSIDGLEDSYNYIRQDASFDTLKKNILELKKHPYVKIEGAFCFQIYNAFSICDTFNSLIEEFGFNEIRSNTLTTPNYLDARIIPPPLKKSVIENMEKYYNNIGRKKWPMKQNTM